MKQKKYMKLVSLVLAILMTLSILTPLGIGVSVEDRLPDTPIQYETQKLLASDGANNDQFGDDVAIDDNVVIVGARGEDKADNNPNPASCMGLTVESYVGDGWVENGFTGLTAWRIYVNFDDPSDILWAVFGSPDHPMVVTSTNGLFHNDPLYDSLWYPDNLTGPPFYYWANQWDTYVTIGDPWPIGVGPSLSPGFGEEVENFTGNFTTSNAAWFIPLSNPQQGMPDEDGRVLIAQFVVAQGQHISGSLNLAYSNGEHMLDEEFSSFILGDINGDGIVNVDDLLLLLDAWGPNPGHPADINGDGVVNVEDLLIVLANWS